MLNTNISVLITSKCTLNCEYCSSGIPYHKQRHHIPAEKLLTQIKKILCLYTAAGIPLEHLDLLGGEPLLYPELTKVVSSLYEYRCIFHELRVLTNGTILPSQELLRTVNDLSDNMPFLMLISDYGDLSPQTVPICELLEEYQIPYRVDRYHDAEQYFGGWVSYGQDGIFQGTAQERYQKCAFYNSGTIETFEGYLYPCVRSLALHSTGRDNLPPEDYICLQDDFSDNVQKLSSFLTRKFPYAACEKCAGLCSSAVRYPAAKQLVRQDQLI